MKKEESRKLKWGVWWHMKHGLQKTYGIYFEVIGCLGSRQSLVQVFIGLGAF
jgi:hypothetical protein